MTISKRLQKIRQLINETALECGRNPEDIKLLGVTKGQTTAAILEAYHAGLTEFAESYWQEAQPKLKQLADLNITWHFIGPLQSNKAAEIARHFDWVHSLSREKIARLLATHRPQTAPPLNVCIQVNLDDENTKSGIPPEAVYTFATQIHELPTLKLQGLMTIPAPLDSQSEQLNSFLRLSTLRDKLNSEFNQKIKHLSMGMSDDFVAAIHAGSTIVRIGQAIFGSRDK